MNLFKCEILKDSGYIFINEVDLISFIRLWGNESGIEVDSFSSYFKDEYYGLEQLLDVQMISDLIDYIKNKQGIVINDLGFTCGAYRCFVNDMYEYSVYSDIDSI